MLKVNEIFGPTIQGEGPTTGEKCIFIRLFGCNLQCSWCDSKYAWDQAMQEKEAHDMSILQVANKVVEMAGDIRRVVITGGEPLLQQLQLTLLVALLKDEGFVIEVKLMQQLSQHMN